MITINSKEFEYNKLQNKLKTDREIKIYLNPNR